LTISVLARLLELNAKRAREEARAGAAEQTRVARAAATRTRQKTKRSRRTGEPGDLLS
jgi:hypothetical protein